MGSSFDEEPALWRIQSFDYLASFLGFSLRVRNWGGGRQGA
jgi:hypothetical protein